MDCRDRIYKTTGGFVKGICHPKNHLGKLSDLGFDWVRSDMPFPVRADGEFSDSYLRYRAYCMELLSQGVRTIAITNYGSDFIENGVDVRTEKGLDEARKICEKAARDLAPCVGVWQIANEVNLTHMRVPLTSEEGKNFIIACMQGVKKGNPDAVVGHNSFGEEWLKECLEIEEKTGGSDYIGLDLYDCTWTPGPVTNYEEKIEHIYQTMGKPVILMEFGFSSLGHTLDMAKGDVDRWLAARGIKDLDAAYADPAAFVDTLKKPRLIKRGREADPGNMKSMVIPLLQHESESWLVFSEFEHTEKGQADFYDYLLPRLLAHPHLAGAVIYCMRDDDSCYFCGSPTCCCEIAWGLVHHDGSPKPAYDIVKKYFNTRS
ncbi:MAG: hypothetical protein IJR83_01185 [Clostridia bacterium]|nr:hypothetical protein [Clostridia bacterium]